MNRYETYREKLACIPPPGEGGGCHGVLLGAANLGVRANLPFEVIFSDIRQAIPPGRRRVPDREITDAINRAMVDHNGGSFYPRPAPEKPMVRDGVAALRRIIESSVISDEADLWEASPIRINWLPKEDTTHLLLAMYDDNDTLFIGGKYDVTPRPVSEWLDFIAKGGSPGPQFIPNPLSGQLAPNKAGDGETYRGDYNVIAFRHCVVEFDNLSREDQIRFWTSVRLPICGLIDSGGKSIHAIIDVQKLAKIRTYAEWAMEIERNLYDRLLVPIGVDSQCKNPARLSRLPGHFRAEKGRWQRLLWLAGRHGRTIL
jgi:hypothetical protein